MTNQNSPTKNQSWASPKSRDVWERHTWLWTLLYFVGIFLGLIFAFEGGGLPKEQSSLALGLCALLGIWHLGSLVVVRRIGHYREHPVLSLVYIFGITVIWFALVRIDPGFYVTQMGLWNQIFIVLPILWASGFAILIFGLNLYQQTLGVGIPVDWEAVLLWLGFTVVGLIFGVWIHSIITQSMERKKLIQQLEETRTELAQSEREAGMLAERQRLAQEIHDTLAQGFISIIMHLEAAEQALPPDAGTTGHHLNQARQTARESLGQARRVVNDLRPEVLERAPFDEAIQRVVLDWSDNSGVAASFIRTGECDPLHPEMEVTLLRAAQEALANVRRHAQAQNVQVTLSYMGDVVILDVEDDGTGFTPGEGGSQPDLSGGFGLVAMRQRVEQLGGELLIESEPGAGTTVAVSIPIK